MNPRFWPAALLLAPACAWAHSPVPGLGRFYSGMLHPVLAPAALIALVALGLLLGQQGLAASRRGVLAFVLLLGLGLVAGSEWQGRWQAADREVAPAASSAAGPAAASGPQTQGTPGTAARPNLLANDRVAPADSTRWADTALLLAALATAACALAALRLPRAALALLAASVGLAAGFGLADMAVGEGRWVVVAGTWLGGALLALGVAAVAELARPGWQHVARRVLASWMAAAALLVLGLQWAGPLPVRAPALKPAIAAPAPPQHTPR